MNAQFIKKIISENILKTFLKKQTLDNIDFDKKIVGLDIGYGYTKYTTGIDEDGNISCELFPSQACLSPRDEMSGGFFVSRNTKKVESGGTVWEVGPDVFEIASKNEVRALHENFVSSEQWKILFLGALAYIDIQEIDVLVLGLPVSNMNKEQEMKKLAIGTHVVEGKEYTIKEVLVVPQPLGALYNYAITSNNFERFCKTNTLVVDPGYLTFDFLVTKGIQVNPIRSGARPGGMSAVLNAIASSISNEIDERYDDYNEIDLSLDLKNYNGIKAERPVWIYGKEIDLNEHIKNTKPVIDTSLNFMLNKIGEYKDIAQVVMAGGPNKIFDKSVKSHFSKHPIFTLKEGIFSNVCGFLLWGMMIVYGQELQKASNFNQPTKQIKSA